MKNILSFLPPNNLLKTLPLFRHNLIKKIYIANPHHRYANQIKSILKGKLSPSQQHALTQSTHVTLTSGAGKNVKNECQVKSHLSRMHEAVNRQ